MWSQNIFVRSLQFSISFTWNLFSVTCHSHLTSKVKQIGSSSSLAILNPYPFLEKSFICSAFLHYKLYKEQCFFLILAPGSPFLTAVHTSIAIFHVFLSPSITLDALKKSLESSVKTLNTIYQIYTKLENSKIFYSFLKIMWFIHAIFIKALRLSCNIFPIHSRDVSIPGLWSRLQTHSVWDLYQLKVKQL